MKAVGSGGKNEKWGKVYEPEGGNNLPCGAWRAQLRTFCHFRQHGFLKVSKGINETGRDGAQNFNVLGEAAAPESTAV